MHETDRAITFLKELSRNDLAGLIQFSKYDYIEVESWLGIPRFAFELVSPKLFTDAIHGLPEWDQKRIAEAIHSTHKGSRLTENTPESLVLKFTDEEVADNLFPEIIIHKNQLIAVATGRSRIQDIDDYYKARHKRISLEFKNRGIDNPNPFDSLWDWYKKWKEAFASYSERRRFIGEMYEPIIKRVLNVSESTVTVREPTGWERVDRAVDKARIRMENACHEEDYQTVGLLCREVLISLGQAVYDPAFHESPDGVVPSTTDAGRMIEAFINQSVSGSTNENIRRYARAALQLAIELQHKRTADFRNAALCLEATSSTANIVAIISGQRDQDDDSIT
jgi:hypothetical protein